MAKISSRFVAQVARELPERWEQIVRIYIADRPNEAKALGSSGLSALKSDLTTMREHARDIAARHLSGPKVWSHEKADGRGERAGYKPDAKSSSNTERQRWSHVSGPISRSEAEVLELLKPGFGSEGGTWLRSTEGKLSSPLEAMIVAYQKLHLKLERIDAERDPLVRQIATLEAQELWENA